MWRFLYLGIESERSIKLSNDNDEYPHFMHVMLLQSWPSKRSVIIELSLSLKYLNQISDCTSIGSLSQSIVLYLGFLLTLLSSLCIPSRKNLKNSCASCWPYPPNYLATLLTELFKSDGVTNVLLVDLALFSNAWYEDDNLWDLNSLFSDENSVTKY